MIDVCDPTYFTLSIVLIAFVSMLAGAIIGKYI